jgi:hypothetical protein
MFFKYKLFVFLLLLVGLAPNLLFAQAQGIQTDFGKNRVQYKDFQWFYYRSPHFDTYYYKDGKELAAMVGKIAEQNLRQIEDLLDYKLEGRIKILSYNKFTDLKQTNLGLITDQQQNTGGLTQIVGNKLFVYFDGNTIELQKQIRKGIAQILISDILYGGNIQEKVSNSTLLTLPDWYLPGLTSFLAEEWNIQIENELKDGIVEGRYKKFNRIPERDVAAVGHSIWKYVVDNFGAATISNIVYMTRVNRNAENGFSYIIGLDFKELGPIWLDYYTKLFKNDDLNKDKIDPRERFVHKNKKRFKKLNYVQFKVSPDGKSYAYVVNREGKYSVYIYDLVTNKTKRVFKTGMKSVAFLQQASTPIITWHPSSFLLAIAFEKRSMPFVQIVNLRDKKESITVNMYKYEKILDFDYAKDGRKWVLSALRNGQSDLYIYDIPSRRDEQITNDWYDDLTPRFLETSDNIIFSSNRQEDSLNNVLYSKFPNINSYDLFLYNYEQRNPVLTRVTNTPFVNEISPVRIDTMKMAYLSDVSGIINRNILTFDSVALYSFDTTIYWYDTTITVYKDTFTTHQASNYSRNIIDHDQSRKTRRFSEIISKSGQLQVFIKPISKSNIDTTFVSKTPFALKQQKLYAQKIASIAYNRQQDSIAYADSLRMIALTDSLIKLGTNKLDPGTYTPGVFDTYYFQSEFPRKKSEQTKAVTQKTADGFQIVYIKKDKKAEQTQKLIAPTLADYFKKSSPKPYTPEIATNYVVSQIDNSSLTNTYQQFTGVGPIFINANVNALIKLGTADLMEDYRITGGFRLAGNLTIPEYYLSYENLKRRLDKQFIFYKQGGNSFFGFNSVKTNSYEFRFVAKYPFNEHSALRGSVLYRRDELILLSTDSFSINVPNFYADNFAYRLEYVYDNTISKGLNLFNGTRYKIYFEHFKEFGQNNENFGELLRSLGGPSQNMVNIGFDYRRYEKIHRQIIFAGRVAGSSSLAKQKVMYYLGGVDGWLIPRFNNDIQIDQTREYKYQALATNMRGFTQNIRNGNNFLVVNTEIRFPVFSYFLNRPIKSDFVKNFQLMPFADLGAAWLGSDMFSDENRFNRIEVQGDPVSVTAIQSKYPIVGGYGWGARSRLLGYFVRFDMAWGVQNNMVAEKPVYYVSLSLDF